MTQEPTKPPETEPRAAWEREAVELDECRRAYRECRAMLAELRQAIGAKYDDTHNEAIATARRLAGGAGEQSGAIEPEPWQVVRISEWLERLRVIHMGALAALAEAVGTDRLHRIIGPAIGADLVSAGMLSRYEELGPTDEDGESFIVYELTEAGAAAGLAWGKAMRHGRSNN